MSGFWKNKVLSFFLLIIFFFLGCRNHDILWIRTIFTYFSHRNTPASYETKVLLLGLQSFMIFFSSSLYIFLVLEIINHWYLVNAKIVHIFTGTQETKRVRYTKTIQNHLVEKKNDLSTWQTAPLSFLFLTSGYYEDRTDFWNRAGIIVMDVSLVARKMRSVLFCITLSYSWWLANSC